MLIAQPIIQDLGMQGEHLLIKVKAHITETNTDGTLSNCYHGIILKLRVDDLPIHSEHGETIWMDLTPMIKERFGHEKAVGHV